MAKKKLENTHPARTRFDTHRQNAHQNQEKRTNALPNKKEFAPLQCKLKQSSRLRRAFGQMLAHGGHVSSAKTNRPDHHLIDFTTAMFVIAAAFPIIFFVPRVKTV